MSEKEMGWYASRENAEGEIGVRDREGNENEGDNVAVCIPVLLLETVKLLKVHLR